MTGPCEAEMGGFTLKVGVLPLLAERFRALSEPARLSLLSLLQSGEHTVNELVTGTGLGQANVSKHLRILYAQGFVTRRKTGLFVHYALADRRIMKVCELMSHRVVEPDAVIGAVGVSMGNRISTSRLDGGR